MSENTEKLLQDLAEKLGTTTEYLWGIIVAEAKYDVLISSIQMVFMAAIVIVTIKLHLKFSKEEKNGESMYYRKEELLVVPMIFAAITSVIMIIFFLSGFNELVSAIFNPEYWALRQILHELH